MVTILERMRALRAEDPALFRARALLILTLVLLAVRLIVGDNPWTGGIAERIATGEIVRPIDYARTYGWWVAVGNVILAMGLLVTARRWLTRGDPVEVAELAPPAGVPRRAFWLLVAAAVVTPDTPLGDLAGPYCESKRACEELVRARQAEGAPITTLVLGAVYGPDSPAVDGSADSLISMLASMMLLTEGGLGVIDVRDVAGLAVRALEPGHGPRHLLAGGPFLTWAEYVAATEEAAGRAIATIGMGAGAVVAMGRDLDARRALGEAVAIPLSEEAAAIMTSGRPTDDSATWASLGGSRRSTVDTLRAMLRTLIEDGHLDPGLAPAAAP